MMIIGFTGTRSGMTAKQYNVVQRLIGDLKPDMVIHGDCYGADTDFHKIVRESTSYLSNKRITVKIYPSNLNSRANNDGDIIMPPDDPIVRDREIVKDSSKLIATPKSFNEVIRSGTWTTVRYAKKLGKVVYIVQPDGNIV
jgi:hypothetical protein